MTTRATARPAGSPRWRWSAAKFTDAVSSGIPTSRFIAFLESLARRYPKRELHLICDNYGTHKHPAVTQWLAAHPRFQLHFTPTSASWLSPVERWFALITGQAIRRGSFDNVARLEKAIMSWLQQWNQNAQPFRSTKSATRIRRSINNAALIYET